MDRDLHEPDATSTPPSTPPLMPAGLPQPAADVADGSERPRGAAPANPFARPVNPLNAADEGGIAPDLEYLMTPEPERTVGPFDVIKLALLVLVRKPHVLLALGLAGLGVELLSGALATALSELIEPVAALFRRTPMDTWLATGVTSMVSWGACLLFQGPLVGATIEASSDRAPKGLLLEFLRRALAHLTTVIAVTGLTTLFFMAILVGAVVSLWLAFQVAGFLPVGLLGLLFQLAAMVSILFVSINLALGVSLGIPVILVEEVGVIAALRRSWKLTANNRYAIAFAAIIPVFLTYLGVMVFGFLGAEFLAAYVMASGVLLLLYFMGLSPAAYVVFRAQIERCRPDQLLDRPAPARAA